MVLSLDKNGSCKSLSADDTEISLKKISFKNVVRKSRKICHKKAVAFDFCENARPNSISGNKN
jgi:hypothetical protein